MKKRLTKYDEKKLGGSFIDLIGGSFIDLPLSVRTANALVNMGIETVQQLMNITPEDFLRIRNIGMQSLFEMKASLSAYLGPETFQMFPFGNPIFWKQIRISKIGYSPSAELGIMAAILLSHPDRTVSCGGVTRAVNTAKKILKEIYKEDEGEE